MSEAAELATVVEGWATLAGLFVIVVGAAFAGVQLRQEAKARKLQALMSVLTDIHPPAVTRATRVLASLPDGFDPSELTEDERDAVVLVGTSYARLGTLLAVGAVEQRDIFPHPALSRGAIEAWEKLKHVPRTVRGGLLMRAQEQAQESGGRVPTMIFHEQLAARAQAYLLREGVKLFRSAPVFDADWDALNAMGEHVKQARAMAS